MTALAMPAARSAPRPAPRSLPERWTVAAPTVEVAAVALLLLAVALVHGVNMDRFPYYENDEGTYMSQAQAFVEHGRLAPYTYWYDHAPAGWMLIGVWSTLTGGFYSQGFSINSGRSLMLVIHLVSALLLYLTVRRITGKPWAAMLAVAAFSFAPGAVYYQRRVLLDNIAVLWSVAAVCTLTHCRQRLGRVMLAALFLALAMLSKETGLFFAPVLTVAAVFAVSRAQRLLAGVLFAGTTVGLCSLYFLYALLKGELFPTGSLLGGTQPHVSLVGTIQYQDARSGHGVLAAGSAIRHCVSEWWANDPVWVVLLVAAVVWITALAVRRPAARLAAGLLLAYVVFLVRGGVVLPFYVVPLVAVVALAVGVAAGLTFTPRLPAATLPSLPRLRVAGRGVIAVSLAAALSCGFVLREARQQGTGSLFSTDQTKAQLDAVSWLLQRKSVGLVAVDDYSYDELHDQARFHPQDPDLDAEYYWKLDADPTVRADAAHDDPADIDYLAETPQMSDDLSAVPFVGKAAATAKPIVEFDSGGWSVRILGSTTPARELAASWADYTTRFIAEGQVVDPQAHDTTSEGEAYALLRAVEMGDRATFDQVLGWADAHLLVADGLWGYRYDANGRLDPTSASDADTDAALALILAGRRWASPAYTARAERAVGALWNADVASVHGSWVMTAGPWAHPHGRPVVINPSYISPAAYRAFAVLDSGHDWRSVLASGYAAVTGCSTVGGPGLPPDWCALDRDGAYAASSDPFGPGYGFDAFRTGWRLALDYQWSHDPRDVAAAAPLAPLVAAWKRDGRLDAAYHHDGSVAQDYENSAAYGASVGAFMLLDPHDVGAVVTRGLDEKFYEDAERSYWQDPENYYTQNWAWFGLALSAGTLSHF